MKVTMTFDLDELNDVEHYREVNSAAQAFAVIRDMKEFLRRVIKDGSLPPDSLAFAEEARSHLWQAIIDAEMPEYLL